MNWSEAPHRGLSLESVMMLTRIQSFGLLNKASANLNAENTDCYVRQQDLCNWSSKVGQQQQGKGD
jgi:hypothetical protein